MAPMTRTPSMGRWTESFSVEPHPFGEETSYRKAVDFLDVGGVLEDWGCGTGWARRYVKNSTYVGLDGSPRPEGTRADPATGLPYVYADRIVDLREYRSDADSILLRQVLESNWEWREILANLLASFRRRAVIVLFTPFSASGREVNKRPDLEIPELRIPCGEFMGLVGPTLAREETLASNYLNQIEQMFYLERR